MYKIIAVVLLVITVSASPAVWAHAFPDNSAPHVGARVSPSPKVVKVWFDGEIEPVFSTLIVKNAAGVQVSQGQGAVSSSDNTLLQTTLTSPLPPGQYWVYWSVIARDGHHTAGHFPFTVS